MSGPRPPLEPDADPVLVVTPEAATSAGIAEVAAELPDPHSLAAGSWLALSAGAARQSGFFARFSRRTNPGVRLAVRCTALLVRGYSNVCADESGIAYGQVPMNSRSRPERSLRREADASG